MDLMITASSFTNGAAVIRILWEDWWHVCTMGAKENPMQYSSFGNGTAMRVSPVNWGSNEFEFKNLLDLSEKTAVYTHNYPKSFKCTFCNLEYFGGIEKLKELNENVIEEVKEDMLQDIKSCLKTEF